MNAIASFLKSVRFWGLIGTAVALYFLVFVVFGRVDVSGIMPDTNQMARNLIENWPHLPFFEQTKEKTAQGTVIMYTVPTHQMTRQELAQMGLTNAVAHPAKPR